MMMISAKLCRSVENIHGDMSYVLIGGPTKAVILVAVFKFLAVKIQPWAPLTVVGRSGEGTEKVY